MGEENTIALSVRNVSKSYGSVKVLDNISVDVPSDRHKSLPLNINDIEDDLYKEH